MRVDERQSVILASLFHDIGKFLQRAEEELPQSYKNLASIYCPFGYTHLHLLYSAWWVRENLPVENKDLIENLILAHHKPEEFSGNKRLSKIITLADWLSSGERGNTPSLEGTSFKKTPLKWPFSEIKNEDGSEYDKFCKLQELIPEIEKISPVDFSSAIGASFYKDLLEKFYQDAEKIKSNPLDDFYVEVERMLYLLEKYTLFIPSSTVSISKISLYHHLKTTAAIAVCLYDSKVDEKEIEEVMEKFKSEKIFPQREERFIIISGDISGIQDFIYSVIPKGALKQLRGRALYLQLLSEISARFILKELELPFCNLLYCGGGNFMILSPNSDSLPSQLEKIIQKIDNTLFRVHRGKLGIIISSTSFSYDKFHHQNFKELINEASISLAKEKRKKFKTILDKVFQPEEVTSDRICKICGKEIKNEDEKCDFCKSFEDLSSEFVKAKYVKIKMINRHLSNQQAFKTWKEVFNSLGFEVSFEKFLIPYSYILNSTEIEKDTIGFKFEAHYVPSKNGQIYTLEDMAEKSTSIVNNEKFGVERWGVLRMDVDNLGEIFSKRIDTPTISKYSFISYMLNFFFQAGIDEIIRNSYKDCMVIYSGGDDLCIVGPWNVLPSLALEIKEKFEKFVANNSITISGGIYIPPSEKFPVYQAAKEAGEAEEKAKGESKEKNRVSFLSEIMKWEELKKVSEVKKILYENLTGKNGKKKIPRSLLNILYAPYQEEKLFKEGKLPIIRIWRVFYAIKRFIERHKKAERELVEIREKFIKDSELQPKLNVAVRWAELETRKVKGR